VGATTLVINKLCKIDWTKENFIPVTDSKPWFLIREAPSPPPP